MESKNYHSGVENGLEKFYEWAEKNDLDASKAILLSPQSLKVLKSDAQRRIDLIFCDENPNWEKMKQLMKKIKLNSRYKMGREFGAVDILELTSQLMGIVINNFQARQENEIFISYDYTNVISKSIEGKEYGYKLIHLLTNEIINKYFDSERKLKLKFHNEGIILF